MDPPPLLVMGGIGSGKSSFMTMLAEVGAHTADADQFGHLALNEDPIRERVARRWPSVLIGSEVDRARLAEIVFSSPADMAQLEKILHPRIRSMIDEFVSRTTAPVAIEVSVPHAAPSFGRKLVVDLSNEVRTRRLLARGMTPSQIDLRIGRQLPREGYLHLADLVVNNDGDERCLTVSVGRVWRWWHAQPQARSGPADNHTR